MYGGLFGDLPPTKKETEGQQPPEKKRPRHDGQIILPRPRPGARPAKAPAPVVAVTNTATTTTTTALPSVVSRLGVSGTAVAFVPAAVRNKRTNSSITVTTSVTTSSSQEPSHAAPTRASINQGNYNAKVENSFNFDKSMAYGNARQSQQREEQNQQQQYDGTSRIDKVQDITSYETQNQQLMSAGTGGIEEWKNMADAAGETGVSQYFNDGPATQRMIHNNNNNNNNNNKRSTTSNSGDSYEAPHSRKQQEDDRYDPFVPNDLLEYWERLAVQRALEEQEQQRREIEQRLAEEERLRQQRRQQEREQQEQQQRQRLEQEAAAASARNSEPYGYTNQRPLGRGRGVSNLPAWLVEKKRRESEGGPGGRR